MVMSDKLKYKYICTYCGKSWELSYKVRNMTCTTCKDDNVKCEEVQTKDYYGNKKEQQEIEDNSDLIYWRD